MLELTLIWYEISLTDFFVFEFCRRFDKIAKDISFPILYCKNKKY